jgi:predicted nucleic acid-binding protein
MSFLADTNVLSELARREPDEGVLRWASGTPALAVSAITVEEIRFGLSWKPNARVDAWLARFLDDECEVLPVTGVIARRAGQLRGELQRQGKPRQQADMLIAATAAVHGLTLVTRNHRDFAGCGVSLLDPFAKG